MCEITWLGFGIFIQVHKSFIGLIPEEKQVIKAANVRKELNIKKINKKERIQGH